jgi:hypothetical protein
VPDGDRVGGVASAQASAAFCKRGIGIGEDALSYQNIRNVRRIYG